MTDREKLTRLIDAVFEWASRPTKDGAKNLRNLANDFDPRYNDGGLTSRQKSDTIKNQKDNSQQTEE